MSEQYAVAYTAGAKYYGAQAIINLWKPNIQQPNEFSLSQFWIGGGSNENINTIEAGWQACPNLYGDYNPRLFIYWTSDGYHTTGCYNLHCSGFIQVNNQIAMGGSLSPISAYGGSQYAINILVWKDPGSGNWWMRFGNSYVGYWPSSLFSDLDKSASFIEWGGEIINSKSNGQHTSTNMGSGHFPREGFSKASFFKNIQVVDGSNYLIDPNGIGTIVTQSNCYDIQTGSSGSWGNYFFYGGSGRNNNCP
ncbi:uncharacterized protein LOC122092248 [Macadamia integrifolia]|uniref:uncharacterized protein LOC122092248 n=1 Tax=Macadamia integrifolia TaxID=60698 RepID=UPI001C4E467D|nr:uncharacterized protein LOC122092248 [Macadamia integrifolia]